MLLLTLAVGISVPAHEKHCSFFTENVPAFLISVTRVSVSHLVIISGQARIPQAGGESATDRAEEKPERDSSGHRYSWRDLVQKSVICTSNTLLNQSQAANPGVP